jgi:KDO2-lipid IV(A) lauroyltransferase
MSQHQRFVEWYLYPTRRGRRFVKKTYQDVSGTEYIDAALGKGRGVIILVFHFGMAKMMWPALKSLGYESHQHVFRGATFAGKTFSPVARLAMEVLAKTERNSGLKMVYHRPFFTLEQLYRLLRRNEIVGMNGDGMMGSDFITLPFLDGKMQFPRGPARLAARADAPIIPAYAIPSGIGRHRLVFHPPLYCNQDNPQQVDQCVTEYVEILDDYVRSYPWEWWTWRRIDIGETEEGEAIYSARALGAGDGSYHVPPTTGQRRAVESR